MLYETITLYFTDNSLVCNRNHFSCLLLKKNNKSLFRRRSAVNPDSSAAFILSATIQHGDIDVQFGDYRI